MAACVGDSVLARSTCQVSGLGRAAVRHRESNRRARTHPPARNDRVNACCVRDFFISLSVFHLCSVGRTKPLVVDFVPAGRARPTFRAGNVHRGNTNTNASASSSTTRHPAAGSRKRNSELVVSTATATSFSPSVESSLERSVERREPSPERVSGNRRGPRTVSWNIPGDGAPEGREGGGNGCGDGGNRISDRGSRNGREAGATAPPPAPLLLSWEGLRYSIPVPRQGRWFARGGSSAAGDKADAAGLVVLDGVSGFAGPCESDTRAADADAESGEEGRRVLASAGDVEGGGRAGAGGGRSGTVTAIMGPSGAGKTSLLNVISGRVNAVAKPRSRRSNGRRGGVVPLGLDGAVRLNGVVVGAEEVRRVSAYVTQEDVLPETLTCYEHMMFHAHLRLRRGTSLTRRHGRVIEVRQAVGRGWGGRGAYTLTFFFVLSSHLVVSKGTNIFPAGAIGNGQNRSRYLLAERGSSIMLCYPTESTEDAGRRRVLATVAFAVP